MKRLVLAGVLAVGIFALACSAGDGVPSGSDEGEEGRQEGGSEIVKRDVVQSDAQMPAATESQPSRAAEVVSQVDYRGFARDDREIEEFILTVYGGLNDRSLDGHIAASCIYRSVRLEWGLDRSLTRLSVVTGMPGELDIISWAAHGIDAVVDDDGRKYCEAKLRSLVEEFTPTPTPQWKVYEQSVTTHGTPVGVLELVSADDPSELYVTCDDGEWRVVIAFSSSGYSPPYVVAEELRYRVDGGQLRLLDTGKSGPVNRIHVADPVQFLHDVDGAENLVVVGVKHNANAEPGPELETSFDVADLGLYLDRFQCRKPSVLAEATATAPTPTPEPLVLDDPNSWRAGNLLGSSARVPDGWEGFAGTGGCAGYSAPDGESTAALCAIALEENLRDAADPLGAYANWRLEQVSNGLSGLGAEFDVLEFEPSDDYSTPVYVLKYKVRFAPDECVQDRVMLMAVSVSAAGEQYGTTWRVAVCENRLDELQGVRDAMLASFEP